MNETNTITDTLSNHKSKVVGNIPQKIEAQSTLELIHDWIEKQRWNHNKSPTDISRTRGTITIQLNPWLKETRSWLILNSKSEKQLLTSEKKKYQLSEIVSLLKINSCPTHPPSSHFSPSPSTRHIHLGIKTTNQATNGYTYLGITWIGMSLFRFSPNIDILR